MPKFLPVKFQSNWTTLNPYLVVLIFPRSGGNASWHSVNWDPVAPWGATMSSYRISPWEIWMKFKMNNFQVKLSDWWLMSNCPSMHASGSYWWLVHYVAAGLRLRSPRITWPEGIITVVCTAFQTKDNNRFYCLKSGPLKGPAWLGTASRNATLVQVIPWCCQATSHYLS